jgi:hypothetical protein
MNTVLMPIPVACHGWSSYCDINSRWMGWEMDPITLIVTALAAGAASGTAEASASAVKDAYGRLKVLAARRLRGRPDTERMLARHEAAPAVWRAPLMAALADAAADRDLDLVRAARALMTLIDEGGPGAAKYAVDARGAQGVQVGDRARQDNVFRAAPGRLAAREAGRAGRPGTRGSW